MTSLFIIIDNIANKLFGKTPLERKREKDANLSNIQWYKKHLNVDPKNINPDEIGYISEIRKIYESTPDTRTPYRRLTVITLLVFILLLILIIISFILYIPGVIVAMIMHGRYRNKYMKDSNKQMDLSRTVNTYIANGKYSWLYVWYRIRNF